jgi:hypothetical protein
MRDEQRALAVIPKNELALAANNAAHSPTTKMDIATYGPMAAMPGGIILAAGIVGASLLGVVVGAAMLVGTVAACFAIYRYG